MCTPHCTRTSHGHTQYTVYYSDVHVYMCTCTCTRYILSLSFDQFTLYKYVVLYAMYMYVSFLHSRYKLYIDSLWLQYEEQTGESGQSYRYCVCTCTIYCVYIGLSLLSAYIYMYMYMYMYTVHVRILCNNIGQNKRTHTHTNKHTHTHTHKHRDGDVSSLVGRYDLYLLSGIIRHASTRSPPSRSSLVP